MFQWVEGIIVVVVFFCFFLSSRMEGRMCREESGLLSFSRGREAVLPAKFILTIPERTNRLTTNCLAPCLCSPRGPNLSALFFLR